MRIIIAFETGRPIRLPLFYQEILQGFVYAHMNPDVADFLHNRGFVYGKRRYRMFTFSRLMGKVRRKGQEFVFTPPVRLVVSSLYEPMIESLAERLARVRTVFLGNNELEIRSIEVNMTPQFGEEVRIRMLSPIVVYSTLLTPEGKKKTYYYHPREPEFTEIVEKNIKNKFRAFYGTETSSDSVLKIEPLSVKTKDEKVIRYKDFVIKGWMGTYRLQGSPELIRVAYESGIGAKNAQGFGCFELLRPELVRQKEDA